MKNVSFFKFKMAKRKYNQISLEEVMVEVEEAISRTNNHRTTTKSILEILKAYPLKYKITLYAMYWYNYLNLNFY